ncbi:MAG: DUF1684 domain-containing protein [Proteobacteria bacterium]|nr:DUF1684 domain-containing protein [Pseudomonadota bacterium]
MPRTLHLRRGGAVLAALLAAAAQSSPADAPANGAWRAARAEEVAGAQGWLTVVGLHWLRDGSYSIGRARDNDIVLDSPALARHAARLVVAAPSVRLEPAAHSGLTVDGRPATPRELAPPPEQDGVVLAAGSLRLFVIARAGRLALRVRDLDSAARRAFHGLDYFPIDTGWVARARFEPYSPPRQIPITNVFGDEIQMLSPGALVFSYAGRELRLDALLESPGDDHLFVMFADETSGHETYGAGRFLHVPLPADGATRIDFNEAYNPPCAFTGFATCPLPPPQNRLPVAVRAGELRYRGVH